MAISEGWKLTGPMYSQRYAPLMFGTRGVSLATSINTSMI